MGLSTRDMKSLLHGYVEALKFTEELEHEELSEDAMCSIAVDCFEFAQMMENAGIADSWRPVRQRSMTEVGHNFWYTRNGHGVGFWEEEWEDLHGEELESLCLWFGASHAEVDKVSGLIEVYR